MKNRNKRLSASDVLVAALILSFLVIQLYPIIWVFAASFKTSAELSSRPFSFSGQGTVLNYIKIFKEGRIFTYMWNSIRTTFVSLILIMFLSSTAGYALSKFRSRSSKGIYAFFTVGIMIPVQITLIPLFIFYSKMHILNTTFSLVLPQVGFALPLSIMMFVNFYLFVPDDLIEAATIDGCTPYSIFTKILLPLSKNTFVTIASMYSILIWNDFIFSNTFISKNTAKTVAMGLKDYVGAFGNVDWGLTFAAISVSILPPLIVYFALNKQVTAGMTLGAVKG